MISVGNIRDYIVDGKAVMPENAVYVGRASPRHGLAGSPLANPWREGDRHPSAIGTIAGDELLTEYRAELAHWLHSGRTRFHWSQYPPPLRGSTEVAPERAVAELDRLAALHQQYGRLKVLCWCETWDGTGEPPGKCHAEVIREYLEAER